MLPPTPLRAIKMEQPLIPHNSDIIRSDKKNILVFVGEGRKLS